jgi:beta-lactamase regulating signal transducer with metallopeptidase domain
VILHLLVSSVSLTLALIAATLIRPLTARTRHAILLAGLASLALPAPLLANLLEQRAAPLVHLSGGALQPLMNAAVALQPAKSRTTELLVMIWAIVALALLVRWWIVTHRLVSNALRAATPPPARAVRALDAARRRLGLRRSIDLIASPTSEAPAVVRVLRPMLILPADGCDTLDDEELESLLLHECAHVARRDNLAGVLEAFACSLFWFNPLVWIAHHRLAIVREAACDERVADTDVPTETYTGALAKICRALLSPREHAVSCIASPHLKERIDHLMRYPSLRKSAISHRLILTFAVVLILGIAGTAAVLSATTVTPAKDGPYMLNYSMNKNEQGQLAIRVRVVDTRTQEVIGENSAAVEPGHNLTMRFGQTNDTNERECLVTSRTNSDGSGTLTLAVTRNGVEEQRSNYDFPAPGVATAATRTYTGEPISMDLASADLRDVLKTIGQLTGMTMDIAPEVKGTVSVHFRGTPWDQALEQILTENGCAYRLEGNTMHIYKTAP